MNSTDLEACRIGSMATNSIEKWGNIAENRKRLIPFGLKLIDQATYGIEKLTIIQGAEKGRKSTLLLNIIKNIFMGKHPEQKPVVILDVLESSSGVEQVKDGLLCMIAAQYMMDRGHRNDQECPVCVKKGSPTCKELRLSYRSILFITLSPLQQQAIEYAEKIVASWPLYLFGPGSSEGTTRNLSKSMIRWDWMVRNIGVKLIAVDHIQQFYAGKVMTDYEMQQWIIPELGNFVGETGIHMLALSQLSLGTRKDKDGRQYAIGGARGAAEANNVLQTLYDEDNPFCLGIKLVESRFSGKLTAYSKIERASGLIYGEMSTEPFTQERKMTDEEVLNSPF